MAVQCLQGLSLRLWHARAQGRPRWVSGVGLRTLRPIAYQWGKTFPELGVLGGGQRGRGERGGWRVEAPVKLVGGSVGGAEAERTVQIAIRPHPTLFAHPYHTRRCILLRVWTRQGLVLALVLLEMYELSPMCSPGRGAHHALCERSAVFQSPRVLNSAPPMLF